MWWLVGVVTAVSCGGAYLTWAASRAERLHARAAGATAALRDRLDARARAALRLAEDPRLGQRGRAVRAAAFAALEALPEEREPAENDLTRVLRDLPLEAGDPLLEEVRAAGRRLALARQINSDLVRDAMACRRLKTVRLLGLARRLPRPRYFDVDDPT